MAGITDIVTNRESVSDSLSNPTASDLHTNPAGHKNMLHLIQLRWLAVVGQITTISVATTAFGIQLPLPQMLAVLACLIAFNIGSHLRWHEQQEVSNRELFFALLVDVGSLTAQLYFSGGITNPFASLYLLQVILSAVLLRTRSTWIIMLITSLCLAGLSLLSKPLDLPIEQGSSFPTLYMLGMLLCFMLNAALLVVFITRISRNLRAGDALLADLKQRAVEEEHIVRMGLLASGAAHELGTPLATLSVIVGDWKRMPVFKNAPDILDDMTEMEIQLQRCKSIVSGILLSAGETRGESSSQTTLGQFLEQLLTEWRASRPIEQFEYSNQITPDIPVVSDSTLKQMICNVLDNALEASPHWVRFEAQRPDGDTLLLIVTDQGPGFDPAMLTHFGKPYQSSKGKPGRGLGLFLVVNVARTLGGTVTARNRKEGGATVTLKLPLAAIEMDAQEARETQVVQGAQHVG